MANAEMIKANIVQAFVDGIKDLELRAVMKLDHHPHFIKASTGTTWSSKQFDSYVMSKRL